MEKINFDWGLLCSSSVIDKDTNNISLNSVIEEITVKSKKEGAEFPKKGTVIDFSFEFVCTWSRRRNFNLEESADARLEILDPAEKKINTIDYKLRFGPKIKRIRSRVNFNNLLVTSIGDFTFASSIKEGKSRQFKEVSRLVIPIKIG